MDDKTRVAPSVLIQVLDLTFSSEDLEYLKAARNIQTDVAETSLLCDILQ